MKASTPKPLDLYMVQSTTERNRCRIESLGRRLLNCREDSEHERRLKARECRYCFYLSGDLAGQAFTDWTCWSCGTEDSHHNTAVPRLCATCSEKLGLCVRCCADIELKRRKTLERKSP